MRTPSLLLRSLLVASLSLACAPRPLPAEPPGPPPAPALAPDRTDLALRLLALEGAIQQQPAAFATRKREVALKVGAATAGFFMGNFRAAMDAIGEAHALLEQRPWDSVLAGIARLRVLLPASVPLGALRERLATLRLAPLGPLPDPSMPCLARATWRPAGAPSAPLADVGGPSRPLSAWLEQGVPSRNLPTQPGLWNVEVHLGHLVLHGRTSVVHDDTPARLNAAREALAALPSPAPGTPAGVVPTLQRLARQLEQGLSGQGGDVVPDLAEALRRLEEGLAGLAQATAAAPYRPSRPALTGDSHRVTASGQRYRLWVPAPPASAGPPDAQAPPAPPTSLPLVIALHGAGGTEDMYFEAYGAGEALRQARQRGWVLAAPDDSDAALDVLADLQQLLPIDPSRTYLTGHSMGAGAAWRAAMASPQSFTAVACVAGGWMSMGRPDYSRLGSLPLLSITASLDMSRRMAEGTARAALAAGAKVEERLYDDLDHLLVVGCSLPDVFAWLEAHVRR